MPLIGSDFANFPMGGAWEAADQTERDKFIRLMLSRLAPYNIRDDSDLDDAQLGALAQYLRILFEREGIGSTEPPNFLVNSLKVSRRAKVGPFALQTVSEDDDDDDTPSGEGVDEAAVRALVADWAEADDTSQIPSNKLQNAGGAATDQVARDAAAAASAAAAAGAAADFAKETNPSGHIPPARVSENPSDETVPVVTNQGRSFRFVATSSLAGAGTPAATESTRGSVRGATQAQAQAASGTTILGWTNNRIRQLIAAALPTVSSGDAAAGTSSSRRAWTAARVRSAINAVVPAWAREGNTDFIPVSKLPPASETSGLNQAQVDARIAAGVEDWAETGNTDLVPTDKVNFDPLQVQIDELADELAHDRDGTITAVVGVLGSGNDSLRYSLPNDLNGTYDISVRVKARVQVNEFVNISGNLEITADGGLGLNAAIPSETHGFGHAHEATFNFVRKGLTIAPGAAQLTFTANVTSGQTVHFVEVQNLTLTNTSLVGPHNVDPLVEAWAIANLEDGVRDADTSAFPFTKLATLRDETVDALPVGAETIMVPRALLTNDGGGTRTFAGAQWLPIDDLVTGGDGPSGGSDQETYTLVGERDSTTPTNLASVAIGSTHRNRVKNCERLIVVTLESDDDWADVGADSQVGELQIRAAREAKGETFGQDGTTVTGGNAITSQDNIAFQWEVQTGGAQRVRVFDHDTTLTRIRVYAVEDAAAGYARQAQSSASLASTFATAAAASATAAAASAAEAAGTETATLVWDESFNFSEDRAQHNLTLSELTMLQTAKRIDFAVNGNSESDGYAIASIDLAVPRHIGGNSWLNNRWQIPIGEPGTSQGSGEVQLERNGTNYALEVHYPSAEFHRVRAWIIE